MTRKNFEAIVQIIKDNATTVEKQNGEIMHVLPYNDIITDFAYYFKSQNANFDYAKFKEACGIIE